MITLILTRFEVYIHKITVILIYLYVESDEISIWGTALSLRVYPKGGPEKGKMVVFLQNNSDHYIVVDYSIKATPGPSKPLLAQWGVPCFRVMG